VLIEQVQCRMHLLPRTVGGVEPLFTRMGPIT